jgi:hypothetical protein
MVFVHWIRRAACNAGTRKSIDTAMIATTTQSSISVNSDDLENVGDASWVRLPERGKD